jgi:hypothetical protein
MKPLFMLVIVMTSFSGLVNAQPAPTTTPVSAVSSFQKTFKDVDSVEWELTGGLFKAKFVYNERLAYAFFNEQGELLCIARSTSMQQIPPMLQSSFQIKFPDVTIRDAFEISGQTGISYYLTIIKNGKKIILKSSGMENWFVFSKEKKKV